MACVIKLSFFVLLVLFLSVLDEINCFSDETFEINERNIYEVRQLVQEDTSAIDSAEILDRENEYLVKNNFQDNISLLNYAEIVPALQNSISNVSNSSCFRDLSLSYEAAKNVDFKDIENNWAQKMFDSFGKPESGILEGNFKWLGDFDECRSVYAPKENGSDAGGFHGKYCSLGVTVAYYIPLTIGICLPDTCNPSDFDNISNSINSMDIPYFNINITSLTCKANKLEMSNGGIVTIFVISVFLLLVFLGSSLTAVKYFTDFEKSTDQCRNDIHSDSASVSIDHGNIGNGISQESLVATEESQSNLRAVIDKFDPFLNCFCIFTNGLKLLNTDATEGQLLSLHGIRFLSMSWVILCHVYLTSIIFLRTTKNVLPMVDNLPFQAVLNGWYSVDSFFVISGFLLAYLYFQECAKRKGKTPWLYFYIHRYLRLTPVYMIVLAFFTTVFPLMGSGPFWTDSNVDAVCHKNWWLNLLYINNFKDEECIGYSWYLANDMQFFVISPIFLISLLRWPKVGFTILALFLCGSWLCGFLITYQYNLIAGTLGFLSKIKDDPAFLSGDYMQKIYIKPYTRIAPYLIGIGLGYISFQRKVTNFKLSQVTLWIGWILAVPAGLYCVYGVYHQTPTLFTASLFNAFTRTIYGFSLSWLIFVCISGRGGVVDKILSYKLFIPLSRLTYCAYLIHPIFTILYTSSMRTTLDFSHPTVVLLFLGIIMVTYAFAMLVSLTFESPLIRLEKLVRNKFQNK